MFRVTTAESVSQSSTAATTSPAATASPVVTTSPVSTLMRSEQILCLFDHIYCDEVAVLQENNARITKTSATNGDIVLD